MARENQEVGVVFVIWANTQIGECLRVVGEADELGAWDPEKSVPLTTDGKSYPCWYTAPVWLRPKASRTQMEFKFIRDQRAVGGGLQWEDDIPNRCLSLPVEGIWTVCSRWGCVGEHKKEWMAPTVSKTPEIESAYSCKAVLPATPNADLKCSCIFAIWAKTQIGECLRVVGEADELGAWDPEKSVPLTTDGKSYPCWYTAPVWLRPKASRTQMEFKFIRDQRAVGGGLQWEDDIPNRCVTICSMRREVIIFNTNWNCLGPLSFVLGTPLKEEVPAPKLGKGKLQREGTNVVDGVGRTLLDELHGGGCALKIPEGCRAQTFAGLNDVRVPVAQSTLEEFFLTKVLGYMHGVNTHGQHKGDELKRVHCGKLPAQVMVACEKGSKGFCDKTPNQDNWSVTHFQSGHLLIVVCDGHGKSGHKVAQRASQTLPYFLMNHIVWVSDSVEEDAVQKSFTNAFEKVQQDLEAHSLENTYDLLASGSTAVAALIKGDNIWTANTGDSRCAIGSQKRVVFATRDHTPGDADEGLRIEAMGGQVLHGRVCLPGKDFPALGVSRAFGDQCVKDYGVCAAPEVALTTVDRADAMFVILGSDGLWQFLKTDQVMDSVAKKAAQLGPAEALKMLQAEAQKKWRTESNVYCDDITSVIVQLNP